MAESDDLEQLQFRQRLKAAVHYTVKRICKEKTQEVQVTGNPQMVAAIAETTWKQCQNFSQDLEMFAKHAKRTTVNADDVKLLVRKSAKLHEYICALHEQQHTAVKKKPKKTNKKSVAAASTTAQTDSDDD